MALADCAERGVTHRASQWRAASVWMALALVCAASTGASGQLLTYYGDDYPGDPFAYTAPSYSPYNGATPLTLLCSEEFLVGAGQSLASINFVFDPTNAAFPANVSVLLGLYRVADPLDQGSTHYLVLAANGNAPYTTGSDAAATNNATTFTAAVPPTATVAFDASTSATAFAGCVAFSGQAALYYGQNDAQYEVYGPTDIDSAHFVLPQQTEVSAMRVGANAIFVATRPTLAPMASATPLPASSSSSSSSTGQAASVHGDPQFVGLQGQSYQVHGLSGAVYALWSDALVHINSRFRFLSSGRCLHDAWQRPLFTCWSHPGSYLEELSFVAPGGDWLHVQAGPAQDGFAAVRVVRASGAVEALRPGDEAAVGGMAVRYTGVRRLAVASAGVLDVEVENSDGFVNIVEAHVADWGRLTAAVRSHGLLGQTWRPESSGATRLADIVEGDVDDYVVHSGRMQDRDFVFARSAAA